MYSDSVKQLCFRDIKEIVVRANILLLQFILLLLKCRMVFKLRCRYTFDFRNSSCTDVYDRQGLFDCSSLIC